MDELRARRSAVGVGPVLLPRHVPERQPGDRHHPARHRPAGPGGRRVSSRVPEQDLAGLLVPHPLQRLLDLFKTQLGNTDILVRTITDAVWMSSKRAREWQMGIRAIYYGILLAFSVWGVIVIRSASPFQLFKILANMAGIVLLDRRHPDLPRQPAVPAQGRSRPTLARDRPARLLGLLCVLRLLRGAGFAAVDVLEWFGVDGDHGVHHGDTEDTETHGGRRAVDCSDATLAGLMSALVERQDDRRSAALTQSARSAQLRASRALRASVECRPRHAACDRCSVASP